MRQILGTALFILPAVVLVMIFIYIFVGWDAWASLTDWKGLEQDRVHGIRQLSGSLHS